MYGQAWSGVEFFVANSAFKMFRFLVLNENLLVIELSIAIPRNERENVSSLASGVCG
jgi:hypothetical protein